MNSFISWIGGKKLLRKKILEQFPEDYDRYIEVFGGAGWVLFGKEKKGMEVYNDINSELVNLYRCVKFHPETLQKELDGILMSRELFFDFIQNARGLTDIQRAARFFVAIKESYGSGLDSFGVKPKNMKKALDEVKGKWILSYNECPEIRNLYDGYTVISVERPHNLATKSDSKKYKEIIIKNF